MIRIKIVDRFNITTIACEYTGTSYWRLTNNENKSNFISSQFLTIKLSTTNSFIDSRIIHECGKFRVIFGEMVPQELILENIKQRNEPLDFDWSDIINNDSITKSFLTKHFNNPEIRNKLCIKNQKQWDYVFGVYTDEESRVLEQFKGNQRGFRNYALCILEFVSFT